MQCNTDVFLLCSLVWKGYRQPLSEDSVWRQPDSEKAELVGSSLEQAYQRELNSCNR